MIESAEDRESRQASNESLWERLEREPLLERSEAIPIKRSFARQLFGGFYEHLGSLILLNLAVSAQVGVGVLAGLLVALLVGSVLPIAFLPSLALIVVLIGGPAVAGIFHYVRCICD